MSRSNLVELDLLVSSGRALSQDPIRDGFEAKGFGTSGTGGIRRDGGAIYSGPT